MPRYRALAFTLAVFLPAAGVAHAAVVEVHYLDVGQGESVVVRHAGRTVLIDAGRPSAGDEVVADLRRLGVRRIDVAVMSHPDFDHIGGFTEVLPAFPVSVIVRSKNEKTNDTVREVDRLVDGEGARVVFAEAGRRARWAGLSWRVTNPPRGAFTRARDSNNASVGLILEAHGRRAAFLGDAEEPAERSIVERWPGTARIDLMGVVHHGSRHNLLPALLDKLAPSAAAVISVGRNPYGHPTPEATRAYHARGAALWCTQANGDVTARIGDSGRIQLRSSGSLRRAWWPAAEPRPQPGCRG